MLATSIIWSRILPKMLVHPYPHALGGVDLDGKNAGPYIPSSDGMRWGWGNSLTDWYEVFVSGLFWSGRGRGETTVRVFVRVSSLFRFFLVPIDGTIFAEYFSGVLFLFIPQLAWIFCMKVYTIFLHAWSQSIRHTPSGFPPAWWRVFYGPAVLLAPGTSVLSLMRKTSTV